MGRYFGTDGVRGVANTQLSFSLAYELGKAACLTLKRDNPRPVFFIGKDTRISGDMLECAVAGGIMSAGGDVILAGVIPTPAIAALTGLSDADAGCVISASHNPYYDNGIKFFDVSGYKLPDEKEAEIENRLFCDIAADSIPSGDKVGSSRIMEDSNEVYANFLLEKFGKFDLKNMRIVIDCANGATYKSAPVIFETLGAEVVTINANPDGTNINDKCGSTHIDALRTAVMENKAVAGFAFDGDGDRMLACDEAGNEVDGDMIMYLFAKYLLANNGLKTKTVVATTMSNLGLALALEKEGISLLRADVGDRYVVQEMLKGGHSLGGEQSGHIINPAINTTGDGIASAMLLAKIIIDSKKSLSDLLTEYEKYPQVLVNVRVANKLAYKDSSDVEAFKEKLNRKYMSDGRLLLRHSGTEPIVRVMIEGLNEAEILNDANELAAIIEAVSK